MRDERRQDEPRGGKLRQWCLWMVLISTLWLWNCSFIVQHYSTTSTYFNKKIVCFRMRWMMCWSNRKVVFPKSFHPSSDVVYSNAVWIGSMGESGRALKHCAACLPRNVSFQFEIPKQFFVVVVVVVASNVGFLVLWFSFLKRIQGKRRATMPKSIIRLSLCGFCRCSFE